MSDRSVLTDELGYLIGQRTMLESRITAINAQLATADPCGGARGGGTPPVDPPPVGSGTPLPSPMGPHVVGPPSNLCFVSTYNGANVPATLIGIVNENTSPNLICDLSISTVPGDFSKPYPYTLLGMSNGGGFTVGPKPMPGHPTDTCVIPNGTPWYFNIRVKSGADNGVILTWTPQPVPQ